MERFKRPLAWAIAAAIFWLPMWYILSVRIWHAIHACW